jgi:GTP cyclohydrolase I
MKVSETIINRLNKLNVPFFANDNISEYISEDEMLLLQEEVEENMSILLRSLIIDVDNDHNTRGTAKRVAKMYLQEVFKGRYLERPQITDFPNAKHLDEIYTLGPITIRSACSHHLVEIEGQCWVGIVPSERVIGISKFSRLVDWICSRPHIQEEMVIMLADEIESLISPVGLGIVIKAKHHCMTWRGVKETSNTMVNSVVRGSLRENVSMKKEFFDLIQGQGF